MIKIDNDKFFYVDWMVGINFVPSEFFFCQYTPAPSLLHDQHLCHGLMRNYCIDSHGLASYKNIRKFPL